jgi:hypothetical protein
MSLIPKLIKACLQLHNFMRDHGDIGDGDVLEWGDGQDLGGEGGHGGLDGDAEAIRDALAAFVFAG